MKVLKFGGTSVANAERILQVIDIVKSRISDGPVFVVVSAFGGVTNQLEEIAQLALNKNRDFIPKIEALKSRHTEASRALIKNESALRNTDQLITRVFSEIGDLTNGIALVEELTPKMRARLMSTGELLSSEVIFQAFLEHGLNTGYADTRNLIITDRNHLQAKVDRTQSDQLIRDAVQKDHDVFIAPGFISRSDDGAVTTLGRGGSDYTAALVAAAVQADLLEIWTDVDGMLSADPRFVPDAFTIDQMSYEEALELSYFGAKVIYPPTVQPVLGSGIPIYVKNTMNPEHPGTLINGAPAMSKHVVQGFSSIPDIALITLSGSGMVGVPGIAHRFFRALAASFVNVLFITQSSSEHTITVAVSAKDADQAKSSIEEEFELELQQRRVNPVRIEKKMTLVAAVGDGMKNRHGIAGKVFSLLGENGVNVWAIAQGSTERNISFVIKDKDVVKALNTLHEGFFLSDAKEIHLFLIGVGNVGGTMVSQIAKQQEQLKKEYRLDMKIVAMANTKKMAFMPDGIDLAQWKEILEDSPEAFDAGEYIERVRMLNMRNGVFVDNTASKKISEMYLELLNSNVSVITSNKIAASSSFDHYQLLKQTAIDRNVKYLYETNVAAGLPVIKTIRDLVMTGDHIHRIEAVLSGSLNFIFNEIGPETSFSDAVVRARELGYTEPDPSIDLSGVDVMRKILILAREGGRQIEMDDVSNVSYLPAGSLDSDSWESLHEKLKGCDAHVEKRRQKVAAEGKKMRYLASLDGSSASVGVQEIDEEHAAYHLGGTDNIILIYTDRYQKQPLVVKGAGAGPHVTASGVLSDIMRVANF
jgi:aspartokinase/homoserine dehydrogenase 1